MKKPVLRLQDPFRNKAGRMTRRVSPAAVARGEVRFVVGDKLSGFIADAYRVQWGAAPSRDDPRLYLPEARLRALPAVRQLIAEVAALIEETLAAARPPKETGRA